MKANEMTERDLDSLLAAARDADLAPSAALMARVMADAVALQPPVDLAARPETSVGPGRWPACWPTRWIDRLAGVFGGGGALAGISLALVAGLFVGVVQPAPVAALSPGWLASAQQDTVELFPAEIALWEESPND